MARGERVREAGRPGRDALRIDDGAGLGEPRGVDAGGRRHPDLQGLAVGAERGAQPAGAQQRERRRRPLALVVEAEQARGGDRGAHRPADRGRVPPAVVERGVRGARQRAHRLEAGRVGVDRLAGGGAAVRGDDERCGGDRRAEVGDPGR